MLWGCTSKEELYKGSFEGKHTFFNRLLKTRCSIKRYLQTLKIEGINTLHIDAETTSPLPFISLTYTRMFRISFWIAFHQYK